MKISKEVINKALNEQTEHLIKSEIKKWMPSFKDEIAKEMEKAVNEIDIKKLVKKALLLEIKEYGIMEMLSGEDYKKMEARMSKKVLQMVKA